MVACLEFSSKLGGYCVLRSCLALALQFSNITLNVNDCMTVSTQLSSLRSKLPSTLIFGRRSNVQLHPYQDCPDCPDPAMCRHEFTSVFAAWVLELPKLYGLSTVKIHSVHLGDDFYDAMAAISQPFSLFISNSVINLPPFPATDQLIYGFNCFSLCLTSNQWNTNVHRTCSLDTLLIECCPNLVMLDVDINPNLRYILGASPNYFPPLSSTLSQLTLRCSPHVLPHQPHIFDDFMLIVCPCIKHVNLVWHPSYALPFPSNLSSIGTAQNLTCLTLDFVGGMPVLSPLPSVHHLRIRTPPNALDYLHQLRTAFVSLSTLDIGCFSSDDIVVSIPNQILIGYLLKAITSCSVNK